MKFLVLNQNVTDNLGDKLINQMLCDCIAKSGHSYMSFGFAPSNKQYLSSTNDNNGSHNIFTALKQSCPFFIKYLLRYRGILKGGQNSGKYSGCDAIIIGGGQLFKHHSIFVYCMNNWLKYAKRTKKPFAIYGIGIDHNLNFFEKYVYQKVLKHASYINVRDNNSALLIQKYFGINCTVSPDIAFTYTPPVSEHNDGHNILVMPFNYQTAIKYFDINKTRNAYYEDILALLLKKIDKHNILDIILTATTSEDYSECIRFQEYLSQQQIKSIVKRTYNIENLVALFQECSCIITGRMHAMILALICNKEVIPIKISNKINGFTKEYLLTSIDIPSLHNAAMSGLEDCINVLNIFVTNNLI
ncbi:MAG: polysaccharide pyruvyl transferase family protein [Lachnospiraceae bacterium]|nr:polysaccharide pyruvyl transferase family protein [Lachnospiraceae bacterium]MBR3807020.1 polysaccharide pyruvyl transferase family protein [Lachnospiraceae bacterium]